MFIQAHDGSYYRLDQIVQVYVSGSDVLAVIIGIPSGSEPVTLFSCPSGADATATLAELVAYTGVVPITAVSS